MRFLEFIYFAIYSTSLSKNRVDTRFNPAAFIVLIVQPAINSGFGALLNLFSRRHPLIAGSDVIYAKYDIWTYISIVLAVLFSWLFFDRNRAKILAEFSEFTKATLRYVIVGASLYIFLGFYLYTVDYTSSIVVFFGLLVVGNLWVKPSKV